MEGERWSQCASCNSKPRIFPGSVKPIVKATIGATAHIIKLIAALVNKFKATNNTPDYRLFMPVKTCGTDQDCRTGERCQQGICESIPGHVRLTRVMFGPAVTCEADMYTMFDDCQMTIQWLPLDNQQSKKATTTASLIL